MNVYLFRRARSRVVHAVRTRWGFGHYFIIDRVFGGGFSIPCGQPAAGEGVISSTTQKPGYVTCKSCRRVLNLKGKTRAWKPDPIIEDDGRPRILGIPG